MNFEKVEKNVKTCAIVESEDIVITDTQSALDLMATIRYELGTENIAISKDLINRDFFVLSTKLAGEILQKFVNYGVRIAIYGDFSGYTSKPLKDFIFESNRRNSVMFVADRDEAVNKLIG